MKKHNKIFLYAILLILIISLPVEAAEGDKTILILLDELDFDRIEALVDNYYGLGFINIKARPPSTEEGLYMSISSGRKVRLDGDEYGGLKSGSSGLEIEGYSKLYKNLLKKNDNISLELLGDQLKTSFIGDDSSALLAADSQGRIDYGSNYLDYDGVWLEEKTEEALEKTDLLVLSYKLEDQQEREELLKNYINDHRTKNIILLPRGVAGSIGYFFNRNLTPLVYLRGGETGILMSRSTRREGFITLEDLSHEILSNHGIDAKNIGNNIEIVDEDEPLLKGRELFRLTFNLLLIAGLFQGLTYINQLLSSYAILREDSDLDLVLINRFIFLNMVLTLIMGNLGLHQYLLVYLAINLGLTYYWAKKPRGRDFMGEVATGIYILMVVAILFRPSMIYNSYYGFNNLFYGARFYGFNNGAMGIFLATSILSYFYTREKVDNKLVKHFLLFAYFGLNIFILSAGQGANTGGFITATILFLAMIWINMLEDKSNFKRVLILVFLGLVIFAINMYFDSRSLEQSHAIGFLRRIREFGFSEFINMLKIKLKELVKYSILPPFSLVMLGQVLALRKLDGIIGGDLRKLSRIMFFISLVAFVINDTGMIAFIFINQFNIGNIISRLEFEKVKS